MAEIDGKGIALRCRKELKKRVREYTEAHGSPPGLGVILTVMGFAWLDVPESEEQSLGQILFAVTPLVAGVGTGAVLAFINQGLLHLASTRVESLRTASRTTRCSTGSTDCR